MIDPAVSLDKGHQISVIYAEHRDLRNAEALHLLDIINFIEFKAFCLELRL